MKAFTSFGTAVLFLSLGAIVPAFAQQEGKPEQKEQQEHAQPAQEQHAQAQPQQHAEQAQNKQKQQAQSQNKQQHAQQQEQSKQAQQQQAKQVPQKQQQQAKQQNQNKQQQQQQQQAQRQNVERPAQHSEQQQHAQQVAWRGHESHNWQSDHRSWQQRGGYNGYRIPDNRYNGYFGPSHGFVIYNQPYMVVGGFPRFQYNGYWFTLVDPWPSNWSNNWYQTDDVYVVYANNGYYMYDQRYPSVGIAISVSM